MRPIVIMMLLAAGANAANTTEIPVCMDQDYARAHFAAQDASRIMAEAGVKIHWLSPHSCPASPHAIHIAYSDQEPGSGTALAYSLPFEGTTIVIFYDRIKAMSPRNPVLTSRLLAYVLAHEIAHLLQGSARHSDSGIMKANFSHADDVQIQQRSLHFSPTDVVLITRGLAARATETRHDAGTPSAN